ncbi:metallophosphoesterase [Paraflavitalea sp. CAU 1676]|uniref:metallophosphoesterase n=1 Tax=Paraflavitalea sp. CAU 1676 TaxID=3032598 RepID=UPI0023DA4DE9|nr:metallophosphoesterase [Paraflavitalea sp. CAU 1676]MDF2187046.1 metallophosphoesterase family protein [Paraflavitalea sp. CAU 1676]
MKKLLQWLFRKPVAWLAEKVSSSPDKEAVFASLNKLKADIEKSKGTNGVIMPFEMEGAKYIVFSDQHKGCKDFADDFAPAETNYRRALQHYFDQGYTFINIGDCEELWENTPKAVIESNRLTLLEEARFLQEDRYYRVFGNHDLEWNYLIQQNQYLKPIFGEKFKVHEGVLLKTRYKNQEYAVFLTHGHQGDKKSDGNPFSKWVVAAIWTPIQRFLEVTINTTSDSFELVDRHNIMMYEWSATQKNLVFISGHTHKPVFASLDHIDRLTRQLEKAIATDNEEQAKVITADIEKRKLEYAGKQVVKTMAHPSYFNSGCCCFSDGDITGIEISDGFIRLTKWESSDDGPQRKVLEEAPLDYIFDSLI